MQGSLTRVEVRASALIEGRIVDLCVLCGDLWGAGDGDVHARAAAFVKQLDDGITALGLRGALRAVE